MAFHRKRIVWTRPDGGVCIVVPVPKGKAEITVTPARTTIVRRAPGEKPVMVTTPAVMRQETDDEYMDRVVRMSVPPGASYKIVDDTDIPQTRDFREAWQVTNKGVDVEIGKAREVWRGRIRRERDGGGMWSKADAAVTRALATGDQAAAAAAEAVRQQMRDAPNDPRIDAAATLADLMAVNPLPKL